MKRPALQNEQVGGLRMDFRARKVFWTFEKRTPDLLLSWETMCFLTGISWELLSKF